MPQRQRIAVTIGDPSGIGPEVCAKAAQELLDSDAVDVLLVGDLQVILEAARLAGCRCGFHSVSDPLESVGSGYVGVLDPRDGAPFDYTVGIASADGGRAALAWIQCAQEQGRQGHVDGVVYGPVNSDALKLTGLIRDIDALQPAGTYMLRVSGALRVMPITEHVRMRDVAATVTTDSVTAAGIALHTALIRWGFDRPRIAVAGLNPHAMFEEDRLEIAPAVKRLVDQGVLATGPITPDAVFRRAMNREFDAVLTMYHDQGQIALKTAAFVGACTIYVGLEHVEISIPHGTAYDIAGQGKANHASMTAGIRMAGSLAAGKGFG